MHLLPLFYAVSVPCVDHHPTHLLVQAVHLPGSHLCLVAHAQVEVAGVADGGGGSYLALHRIPIGVPGLLSAGSSLTPLGRHLVLAGPTPSHLVLWLALH